MTNDTMTEKILNNFKSIKELIKSQEGLQKKVKRMTEGIDSLRKENYNLKKRIENPKVYDVNR
jgi:regulator of replication initiation timing